VLDDRRRDMGIGDKVSGRAKQAAGSLSGSEALRREGIEDERRGDAKERAAREQDAADRQQERADLKAEEARRLERDGGPAAIPGYDRLNADEAIAELDGLTEPELDEVESHERRHQGRKTVLDAIEARRV
jgi:uncharacterized protein YjbJ (UPF0337 family)